MSLAGHLAHGGPAQPGSIEAISGRHVGCKYVCILVEGSLTVFAVATPSFFCLCEQSAGCTDVVISLWVQVVCGDLGDLWDMIWTALVSAVHA